MDEKYIIKSCKDGIYDEEIFLRKWYIRYDLDEMVVGWGGRDE